MSTLPSGIVTVEGVADEDFWASAPTAAVLWAGGRAGVIASGYVGGAFSAYEDDGVADGIIDELAAGRPKPGPEVMIGEDAGCCCSFDVFSRGQARTGGSGGSASPRRACVLFSASEESARRDLALTSVSLRGASADRLARNLDIT